ncbi:hypothetical protein GX408_02955 [bacterium]|nr:hypothetical protein [bacterium]
MRTRKVNNFRLFYRSIHPSEFANIAITGQGLIWGRGLYTYDKPEIKGSGNKAISLKNCHNVTVQDISILHGGHFYILATGVDNLIIDNVRADADRDAFDIDCCRNVALSNCLFERSRGICIETADRGAIEDITLSNITMRDVPDMPFFIRLNARLRGPEGTPVGVCRRITISHFNAYDVGGRVKFPELGAAMVMGIPGHSIEDLTLSRVKDKKL